MSLPELEFLKILDLQPKKPSLDFLTLLLKRHQRYVPYENLSKLLRGQRQIFTLPSFEEYLYDLQRFGHSGTCFVQNVHFHHLLEFLGFSSCLQGNWINGKMTHPNILVELAGKNFFVDLGIMSAFVGPFVLDPQHEITKQWGDQTYNFIPGKDRRSMHLEIFRKGKRIREIKSSAPTPTALQIDDGLIETFGRTELFMTNLVVHKVFEDCSRGIWNRSFYIDHETTHEVTEIKNHEELKDAFNQLEMPKAQIQETLEVFKSKGLDFF